MKQGSAPKGARPAEQPSETGDCVLGVERARTLLALQVWGVGLRDAACMGTKRAQAISPLVTSLLLPSPTALAESCL